MLLQAALADEHYTQTGSTVPMFSASSVAETNRYVCLSYYNISFAIWKIFRDLRINNFGRGKFRRVFWGISEPFILNCYTDSYVLVNFRLLVLQTPDATIANDQLLVVEPPGYPKMWIWLTDMAALENWEDVYSGLPVPVLKVFCDQETTNRYIFSSSF